MRVESHPFNYQAGKDFTERRLLAEFEGGSLWLAEKDGRYYIIVDEGAIADFLVPGEDDDILGGLVKVYEFGTELERERYLTERGWRNQAL